MSDEGLIHGHASPANSSVRKLKVLIYILSFSPSWASSFGRCFFGARNDVLCFLGFGGLFFFLKCLQLH